MEDTRKIRRDRLRKITERRGLDALLVSQAPNRFYLSGFELHDPQFNESSGHLVISSSGDDWLATDSRYAEAAKRIWPEDRIFIYGGAIASDLVSLLKKCGTRIGLDPKGISWDFYRSLRKSGACLRYEAAGGLVEGLRQIKDESEIACLAASFRLNHQMLRWLEEKVRSGAAFTEKDLSWEIELYFRENGAEELAFSSIVASGKNAALPHAVPEDRQVPMNCPLLVDVGCRVGNYCSDQTRTWWIGSKPDREFAKTLALVQDAQKAALEIMRPGVACADVYDQARRVFEKAGVAGAFTHGLGHGVGLETHEAPRLSPRSTTVLEKGMVVTVEPGLYYPDWGGARWEHTVLVEETGISVF